jgi:hypothetical protein
MNEVVCWDDVDTFEYYAKEMKFDAQACFELAVRLSCCRVIPSLLKFNVSKRRLNVEDMSLEVFTMLFCNGNAEY